MRATRGRLALLIAGAALAAGTWATAPAGAAAAAPPEADRADAPDSQALFHDCNYTTERPNLERGDGFGGPVTNAVKQAQCLLNYSMHPSRYTALRVDGEFGRKTEARVYDFQRCMVNVYHHNIYIDGEIGPQTWPLLYEWAESTEWAC